MSNQIDDGGPAFPVPEMHHGRDIKQACDNQGMTLRDWFAGQIACGDAAADGGWGALSHVTDEQITKRVKLYQRIADAMLAARKEDV